MKDASTSLVPLGLFAALASVLLVPVFSAGTDLPSPIALALSALACTAFLFSLRWPGAPLVLLAGAGSLNFQFEFFGMVSGTSDLLLIATFPGLCRVWVRAANSVPGYVRLGAFLISVGAFVPVFATQGEVPDVAWGFIRWLLFANAVLGGIAVVRGTCGTRWSKRTQLGIVFGGIATAAIGFLQGMGSVPLVGPSFLPGHSDATFNWYSNYTQYLAMASLVALGVATSSAFRRQTRVFGSIASLVMLTQIASSLSRGAILCLLGGLLYLALISLRSIKSLIGLSLVVATLVLVTMVLVPPDAIATLLSRLTTAQGEDNYRSSLQAAGWSIALAEPQGLGLAQFEVYLRNSGGFGALAALAHPHFLPTSIAVEIGWVGLGGFALLVFGVLLNALGTLSRGSSRRLQVGPSIALAGATLQGLVDYFFYETASMVAFLIVLVLSLSVDTDRREVSDRRNRHRETGQQARSSSEIADASA